MMRALTPVVEEIVTDKVRDLERRLSSQMRSEVRRLLRSSKTRKALADLLVDSLDLIPVIGPPTKVGFRLGQVVMSVLR
jgi:hypothetical protein